jgi:hypothetical protein
VAQFEFSGSDLSGDLALLVGELRLQDAELAAIFERHLPLLVAARTDEQRNSARAAFNSAVRADLLRLAAPAK